MKTNRVSNVFFISAFIWSGSIVAQSDSSYEKRTPWGDPDISGMWSYASLTPLQRPERLGEKEFYTPEEAAQIFANTQQDTPTDRAMWVAITTSGLTEVRFQQTSEPHSLLIRRMDAYRLPKPP